MKGRPHCQSVWTGPHHQFAVPCSFCGGEAVFHWRETYPDALLCAECLLVYPEAVGTLPRAQDAAPEVSR